MKSMKKRIELQPKLHVLHDLHGEKKLSFQALPGNEIKKRFNHEGHEEHEEHEEGQKIIPSCSSATAGSGW